MPSEVSHGTSGIHHRTVDVFPAMQQSSLPPNAAARRLQLLEEFGAFIRDRLEPARQSLDTSANSANHSSRSLNSANNDVPPILHRGYSAGQSRGSSNEGIAAVPARVSGEGDVRGVATATLVSTHRPIMAPPASPASPQRPETTRQGIAKVSNITVLTTAGARSLGVLTAPELTPTSGNPGGIDAGRAPAAVEQDHRHAVQSAPVSRTASAAVSQGPGLAAPSRSPSPDDPTAHLHPWPVPTPAPPPSRMIRTMAPPPPTTTTTDYDGSMPSLEMRSPPRTKLLDEVFSLRAENAALRQSLLEQEREGAAMAAEIGRLENELSLKVSLSETLDLTVRDLQSARECLTAELAQAKREAANSAGMYGQSLQRIEQQSKEFEQVEASLQVRIAQLREDFSESLDAAQMEAKTTQRIIDIMSAELALLREQRDAAVALGDATAVAVTPLLLSAEIHAGINTAETGVSCLTDHSDSSHSISPSSDEVVSSAAGGAEDVSFQQQLLGDAVPTNDSRADEAVEPAADDSLVQALLGPTIDAAEQRPPVALDEDSAQVTLYECNDPVSIITLSPLPATRPPKGPPSLCISDRAADELSSSKHSLLSPSFSGAPQHDMLMYGRSTAATQTHVPLVADAAVEALLQELVPPEEAQHALLATPIRVADAAADASLADGGVAPDALENAFGSPIDPKRSVEQLREQLMESKRREQEATQQWAKWVEKCARHVAILNAERQAKEAAEADKIALEARLREAQMSGSRMLLDGTMANSSRAASGGFAVFSESEMKHAVRTARDEGMALAADVADFCMQLLDDVKAGKVPL